MSDQPDTSQQIERTTDPKRILFVAEGLWGCAWYRCHTPAVALQNRGHETVLAEQLTGPLFEQADILVFQRPSRPIAIEAIREAKTLGKLAVVDMDDDMWALHPGNPAYRAWNETPAREVLRQCVHEADLVTVATEELRATTLPMNRRTVVLPNMLPAEHWPSERRPVERSGRLVVGWAGSGSHGPDLELLSGTIETLLDAYPEVEVLTVGVPDPPFRSHPRLQKMEPVMIEELHTIIERFDIGLIPLIDSRFNRCKSDLKFLEYSIVGVPSVASKVAPYENAIEHGVNGFFARNPKDWLKYVSRLIEDADLRDSMGARARTFAERRLVDANIHRWERAYGIGE